MILLSQGESADNDYDSETTVLTIDPVPAVGFSALALNIGFFPSVFLLLAFCFWPAWA